MPLTSQTARATHKLLVANRGEIAVRIVRTAKRLNIQTVAIYTRSDATAPHVALADEAIGLREDDEDPALNSRGYLDAEAIIAICNKLQVTLLHPGYGFLSENAQFAQKVVDAGITWLGPRPDTIEAMGLKHCARKLAADVNVPLVPGSPSLLRDVDEAVALAEDIGFPVMLKSTAGGGGMGLVVCGAAAELRVKYLSTQARAQTLFHNNGVFIEKYYPAARHVEVQVFGDGDGDAIHMGERECSIQRRHQKVIEEAPSPFMRHHPGVRQKMWDAAVCLAKHVKYESAGTIEFLVDDATAEFFFLEMNTRLQVEHPVTEQVNPGLDIVELMILQGIAKRDGLVSVLTSHPSCDQSLYTLEKPMRCAIEARVYCENPVSQFKPSPGILQYVEFPVVDWLRVESWVETGTTITPFFDPLACKLIVAGSTRAEAVLRLAEALAKTKVYGPATNVDYLRAICESDTFRAGGAITTFLETFAYSPRAFTVLNGGLETSVQDYPGRRIGLGMPRSGPMDSLAFRIANILVGNEPGMEALEMTLTGCRLLFHTEAVVAVTGAPSKVSIDGKGVDMWAGIVVPAGSKLVIGAVKDVGMRNYLAIRGGFPEIPTYLSSKSTSLGLGGYQGRKLTAGDFVVLDNCSPHPSEPDVLLSTPPPVSYADEWTICVLPGPQCDPTYITSSGISEFFNTRWTVSTSSNRMGVRLEGPQIAWARENGGEGGAHPSNILDNGYAFGTVNVNGDTPVILTHEGPDMGGYVCVCTIASADLWKLGQLRAGDTIRFQCVSFDKAIRMYKDQEAYYRAFSGHLNSVPMFPASSDIEPEDVADPRLCTIAPNPAEDRPGVVFRQAGDSAILVEFGDMMLDFAIRARIHAFESEVRRRGPPGIWSLAPCIRSTMVHFDPLITSQNDVLKVLVEAEATLSSSVDSLMFPGRRITFPVVLDDKWNREALERYMRSIRATAAYLPSNIEYLARNNGLESAEEALKLLVRSDWLVFGVGFYLACPFLVPIDPRCRLIGQKMNPSRTFTPRGAIGIAGPVAAIYPIESPGGYQLYGRTLPPWQMWGKGRNFSPDSPWLLRPFDQVKYEVVNEEQYIQAEKEFDSGDYVFKIEDRTFSMTEYTVFVASIAEEVKQFKKMQAQGVASEGMREREMFAEWDRLRREDLEARRIKASTPNLGEDDVGEAVTAPLAGNIWKIKCAIGETIRSEEDVLVILEAAKTEVNVEAGEEFVGRQVRGFGPGIREGAAVKPGDALVLLA